MPDKNENFILEKQKEVYKFPALAKTWRSDWNKFPPLSPNTAHEDAKPHFFNWE